MKREIKFRAWSRTGEWDEEGEKQQFEMIGADNLAFYCADLLKNQLKDSDDDFYIMQFTGIKDKNGVDIYEGDIVSFEDDPVGVVKWNDRFCCWTSFEDKNFNSEDEVFDWSQLKKEDSKHYITHGNIYENPELLEKEATNA